MAEPVRAGHRLEVTAEPRPGGWIVRLKGIIDETFERSHLTAGLEGVLVLDLDGVKRITSYGVREWLAAMEDIHGPCYFVRCRPALVSQFNMVGNFAGRGQLVSLYAPYVCERCNKEIEVLIDRRQRANPTLDPPSVRCEDCKEPAEFDDIPEAFFAYVLSAPPLRLSSAARAMIDGTQRTATSDRLKIRKEVRGRVTGLWLSGPLDRSARLKRVIDGLEGVVVVSLAGLLMATEEGLERFRQLTQVPDAQIHLAQVPLAVAGTLARTPDVLGNAQVVSVRLLLSCARCTRWVETDADLRMLKALLSGEPPPSCPGCGARLDGPLMDDLRAVLKLPYVDAPLAVEELLLDGPSDTQLEASTIPRSSVHPLEPDAPGLSSPGGSPPSSRVSRAVPSRLNRYEILRRIAAGGMGTVYLGRVLGAGGFERLVAIKLMHPHLACDPAFVEMFLTEARLAARIRHPNVVATLDIDETQDGLLMVMEYVEGLTVRQIAHRLHRRGIPPPVPVALRIAIDALAGLHAAHDLNEPDGTPLDLVHRDVSPANLLVGTDGITRVTDFGVARVSSRLREETKQGQLKGKVAYMSPEQLRSVPVDRRSDVYSMGVVVWELLAGQGLFTGTCEGAVLMAALQGVTRTPREVNPALPEEISAACMQALTQEAKWRHATAAAFAEELERGAQACHLTIASAREVAALVRDLAFVEAQ